MVRHCLICKKEYGTEPDVSFHSVPKKEDIRAKWLAVLGEVKNSSSVCSKHFKRKDVYYKIVGDQIRRFLCPTAVPCRSALSDDEDDCINIGFPKSSCDSDLSSQVDDSSNDCKQGSGSSKNTCVTNVYTENNVEKFLNRLSFDKEQSIPISISYNLSNNENNGEECTIMKHEVLVDKETIENIIRQESSLNGKCKEISPKKKRLHDPKSIEDLTEDDFITNNAWQIVRTHILATKERYEALNTEADYLQKKIESLKSIIDHHNKNILSKKQ